MPSDAQLSADVPGVFKSAGYRVAFRTLVPMACCEHVKLEMPIGSLPKVLERGRMEA